MCSLGEEDTSRFLLFQIQPHCKKHRHFTKEQAVREVSKGRCIYIGPKQVCQTLNGRIVLCVNPDLKRVVTIKEDEAKELCRTGHAERLRFNVIQIIRNIKIGPALSLKIGHTLAEALARGEMFARIACQEIVNHQPVK